MKKIKKNFKEVVVFLKHNLCSEMIGFKDGGWIFWAWNAIAVALMFLIDLKTGLIFYGWGVLIIIFYATVIKQ